MRKDALWMRTLLSLSSSLLWMAGCSGVDETPTPTEAPTEAPTPTPTLAPTPTETPEPTPCPIDKVLVPGDFSYPESVSVASDGTLYISGTVTGAVFTASACTDTAAQLGTIPAPFAVVGVKVDEARELVWACGTNFDGYSNPTLFALNQKTGALKATHALDTPFGLCNDMVFDEAGNVYITESFGNRLYRVAAADVLSNTTATEWSADPLLAGVEGDFGLNGIAYDDDTLWVVNTSTGKLYEISIGSGNVSEITVTPALVRPDGIALRAPGELLVIEGPANNALLSVKISSSGAAATKLADGYDFATAVDVDGDYAWVVESQFDHLFGYDTNPPGPFYVVRETL